jgi:hypothetical protein
MKNGQNQSAAIQRAEELNIARKNPLGNFIFFANCHDSLGKTGSYLKIA